MKPSTYTCRRCLNALLTTKAPSSQQTSRQLSSSCRNNNRFPPTSSASQSAKPAKPRLLVPSTVRRPASSEATAAKPADTAPGSDPFYVTSLGHASPQTERALLKPDNLFHSFSSSPSSAIRRRAAFMKQHAYCSHPAHQRTRQPLSPLDPENRKPESGASTEVLPPAHVRFECPDCGVPSFCCQEHWEEDYESHLEVCETLKQINEDDHDLHSGRFFPEFEYPEDQRAEEFVINMSNWDTLLYTRDHNAIDDPRSMRQVTRLLTYPLTIASVLHEFSPYTLRREGRLTPEGLRSLSALRYSLHPPRQGEGQTIASLRPKPPPIRLFVLGARAESSLPRNVWAQLTYCFPLSTFHIIFLGPESMTNRDREFPLPERTPSNPFGGLVEDRLGSRMKITTYVEYFQTLHTAQHFAPYDPYFDLFVLFHPGLGHPASSHEWADALPMMLETKCPILCTGYTEWDMERDRKWVETQAKNEVDVLLEPGENIFRSLRWDLNDLDPADVSCGNWGVWAFRGKRYETKEFVEGASGGAQ